MTVQSYIMVRSEGDRVTGAGPRAADLAPYTSLNWSDATGRSYNLQGNAFWDRIEEDPRVMIIDGMMSNQAAVGMSTNPKLWMIVSQRFDTEGELVETNYNNIYTEEERTLRINQMAAFTGFDSDKIAAWWTLDKTRIEVAIKLRDYLRNLT
jgi:hypothetical protein